MPEKREVSRIVRSIDETYVDLLGGKNYQMFEKQSVPTLHFAKKEVDQ